MGEEWARGVTRLAVLTGAGISTDSGIPDYRGPQGVWTKDPSAVEAFRYERFMADAGVRERFWRTYVDHAAWRAEPNAAHRSLAELERSPVAARILTQNIDGLHVKAGTPARKVVELHGTMHEVVCTTCRVRTPSRATLDRVRAGEPDPRCGECGGILKLAVVLFGEHLDGAAVDHAERIVKACHLMLALGTSLQVEPVASLCTVALHAGARLVIVNRDPTPYDSVADEVVREPLGTAVPRLVKTLIGR